MAETPPEEGATHRHTAMPDPADPWCPQCDVLLTWAVLLEEDEARMREWEC
jgi:hypothetical protein